MPILNVSNSVMKYALEVVRIPITVLGDCPQCQSNGFRDGICPDCNFIHPNVQEAIQEWQNAMGIQQVAQQQQQNLAEQNPNAKAAFRSFAFVDMFPESTSRKQRCTKCKAFTFVDGKCEDPKCGHESPPEGLGFKRPKFLGIDPRMLKKVKRNFLSPASVKIEDNKNKLKKHEKKGAAEQKQQQPPMDLGALQDDSMNAHNDPSTRMRQMLQQSAQIDAQNKQQDNNENAENSEELK